VKDTAADTGFRACRAPGLREVSDAPAAATVKDKIAAEDSAGFPAALDDAD